MARTRVYVKHIDAGAVSRDISQRIAWFYMGFRQSVTPECSHCGKLRSVQLPMNDNIYIIKLQKIEITITAAIVSTLDTV